MSDHTALIERLRALLAKTTHQAIDTAEIKEDGVYDCPLCDSAGSIDGRTYTNYDGVAIGVQFFGIGPEHKHAEALFRATIAELSNLLDIIEAQGKRIAELEAALAEIERRAVSVTDPQVTLSIIVGLARAALAEGK